MTNLYYNEVLTSLGDIELRGEAWEFDILAIWVDENTGVFYGAVTSGCSCPTPFEEFTYVKDLDNLGTNPHDVRKYIMDADSTYDDPQQLISTVMNWRKI